MQISINDLIRSSLLRQTGGVVLAVIVAAFEKIAKRGKSEKEPTLRILSDFKKPAISMPSFRQMCMRGENIELNRCLIQLRKFGAKIFG